MREANIEDVNIIIGKGAELVQKATESRNVSYSLQEDQLGTGHAVKCAKEFLKDKDGVVAIFTGDAPLIRKETVKKLLDNHIENGNTGTLLTSLIQDPTGYGRIIRNGNEIERIVEHKDCNEDELKVNEINAGMYCFDIKALLGALEKLSNNNAQGEYYLTDVISILKSEGKKLGAVITEFDETLGVNSRAELAQAEVIMRKAINKKHLDNGVTIIDPSNTYIGVDVVIGQDTIIYPGNVLEGKSEIGTDCVLYPNSRIDSSIIGNEVEIQSSVILQSKIGDNTTVGPFAYVRPESNIGDKVRIGDFVEIKKSTIGNNTKVSPLTYI